MTTVTVRFGPYDTFVAGDTATASFSEDTDTDERKYISIERLSVKDSAAEVDSRYLPQYSIDGNVNTIYYAGAQSDPDERFLIIEFDAPTYLSAFEYTARVSGSSNGCVTKAAIYTSLDGENWELATEESWSVVKDIKVVDFEEPIKAKYFKMVATEAYSNFLAVTMINFFEDTTVELEPEVEEPEVEEPEEPGTNSNTWAPQGEDDSYVDLEVQEWSREEEATGAYTYGTVVTYNGVTYLQVSTSTAWWCEPGTNSNVWLAQ